MRKIERIVGVVANLHHDSGYGVLRALEYLLDKYSSGVIGRCVIRDYSIDAINIAIDLESTGISSLVLVTGKHKHGRGYGLYEYHVEPTSRSIDDFNGEFRDRLAASLTGSLDIDDLREALRFFLDSSFYVVECDSGGKSWEYCRDKVIEYVEKLCIESSRE